MISHKRPEGIAMRRALMVIAKRPQAGYTKTRLTPPLLPQQAAQLYECFLHDTLALVRNVADVTRFILYTPAQETGYFARLAPDFELLAQQGHDLGERLDNALGYALNSGFEQVVIINSDGPNLPLRILTQAFIQLNCIEAVFGPTEDGGYYLIGLTRPQPRLLREVRMSTPTVLQDTLALAEEEKVAVSLLPPWYDIDTIDDLQRLSEALKSSRPHIASKTRAWLAQTLPQF